METATPQLVPQHGQSYLLYLISYLLICCTYQEKDNMEHEYGANNFIEVETKTPGKIAFFYVDTSQYLADRVFIDHKIFVSFKKNELRRNDSPYVVVQCSTKKANRQKFLDAMADLERKMLLLGHDDYSEFCLRFQAVVKGDEE